MSWGLLENYAIFSEFINALKGILCQDRFE